MVQLIFYRKTWMVKMLSLFSLKIAYNYLYPMFLKLTYHSFRVL
jgi:hypothetical protein